jgi:sugar lactone lactonase YvrE
MSLSKPTGWKFAPVTVLAVLIAVCGTLAFSPGNAGDTTADNVLGQPDFVHNAANTPNASTLDTNGSLARVAIDKSVAPNRVYMADPSNDRVLGYSSISALSNGAAASIVIGQPDFFTTTSNTYGRTAQSLSSPNGVAVDSSGNLWVADSGNNRVLEYSTPFSQTVTAGFTANVVLGQGDDFTSNACDNGAGPSNANFCNPQGIAFDASNHLWVADEGNSRILEFETPLTSDVATFLIGQPKYTTSGCSTTSATSLCDADDVAVDSNNNVYVADYGNSRALEYNNALATSNATADHVWGQASSFLTASCNNGGLSATSLCDPTGVGLDGSNNLYIADASNNRILEYNETANPPTNLTANHVFGQKESFTTNTLNNGGLSDLSLWDPQDAEISSTGELVATDTDNNRVLIFDTPLTSQTANVELGQPDFLHDAANTVDPQGLYGVYEIAVDSDNHLYVVDNRNNRVLGYTSAASFANYAPADLVIGQADFYHNQPNQGASASDATLNTPESVATDSSNNLYVSDYGNNRVLEYTAPFSQGKTEGFVATKVWGQSGSFTSTSCNLDGVSATSLCDPRGLALDTHSNLYVADQANNRVLEYTSGSTTATKEFGQGTTGTNFTSNSPNNGGLSASSLNAPFGLATDSKNDVYIADYSNNRALEFNETANPPTNFTANNVFGQAGSFTTDSCNQGLPPSATTLCGPHKLTIDAHSNLYVSDNLNNRVLEFTETATPPTNFTANNVFGQADDFTTNYCNFNGGPGPDSLCSPVGVAVDSAQDLLVGDFNNNRVLKYLQPLATPGVVTLSLSPVAFGNEPQHNTSATKTITVTNTGIVPVLFTGISITGTNAGDFKVVTNTCQGYVPSTLTCTVGVAFTPTAAPGTAESATLTLFDNGSNANQTDSLTGTSIAQVTVAPTTLPFGDVTHGTTSAAMSVTVTNNQDVSVTLSPAPDISEGSATFAVSSTTCGSTLGALASCTVSVTCDPATKGTTYDGQLTITDSPDGLSPHNVSLSCTGS